MTLEQTPTPALWARMELMGHRSRGGRLSEVVMAGCSFLQIETMGEGPQVFRTELYRPEAVYCITPCSEDSARSFGGHIGALPALPVGRPLEDEVDYDDDDGDPDPL